MWFIDVFISFFDVVLCGVKVVSWNNKIVFNFDNDYVMVEGDDVFVIVDDDEFYVLFILLFEV